jgi:ABC-type cobalamin transport system permease subunit
MAFFSRSSARQPGTNVAAGDSPPDFVVVALLALLVALAVSASVPVTPGRPGGAWNRKWPPLPKSAIVHDLRLPRVLARSQPAVARVSGPWLQVLLAIRLADPVRAGLSGGARRCAWPRCLRASPRRRDAGGVRRRLRSTIIVFTLARGATDRRLDATRLLLTGVWSPPDGGA